MDSIFVVFEGPSGSGKSELVQAVGNILVQKRVPYLSTKEPTSAFSPFKEEQLEGKTLFNMLLEDRKKHISKDINPALSEGKIVLCDRYIPSSLVYQRLDGLDLREIWECNKKFLFPDITIFLSVNEQTLKYRLKNREKISRFEKEEYRKQEIKYYQDAKLFLTKKGFRIFDVFNEEGKIFENVSKIVNEIMRLIHAEY